MVWRRRSLSVSKTRANFTDGVIGLIDHDEDVIEEDLFNRRGPSKSSLKRKSTALRDLGQELMDLSVTQLNTLDLPEQLLEAVITGQSIKAHGGLLRQKKFIGKLLRSMDAEPIEQGLSKIRGESAEQARVLHQCEQWRDRMIESGDEVINQFMGQYPDAERQRLRQLVKGARMEAEQSQPKKSARMLFRYLREVVTLGSLD